MKLSNVSYSTLYGTEYTLIINEREIDRYLPASLTICIVYKRTSVHRAKQTCFLTEKKEATRLWSLRPYFLFYFMTIKVYIC